MLSVHLLQIDEVMARTLCGSCWALVSVFLGRSASCGHMESVAMKHGLAGRSLSSVLGDIPNFWAILRAV
jgi:hypothetical protein